MSQRSPDVERSLTREELYDMVWAQPAIMIAAEFGISGAALKKICARNGIPTPARGYWARRKRGIPVERSLLPDTKANGAKQIRIKASPQHRMREALKTAVEATKAHKDNTTNLACPDIAYIEPIVLATTRKALLKARPDRRGFVAIHGPKLLRVSAGTASIERVLGLVGRLALPSMGDIKRRRELAFRRPEE